MEEKVKELMEKLDSINTEVEEWRKKYENLEQEKKALFEELREKSARNHENANKKISEMEAENKEMKKYMRKLEKEESNLRHATTKDMTTVTKRTIYNRLKTVTNRAQKALWFAKTFGLELESLHVTDTSGKKHQLKLSTTSHSPPAKTPDKPTTSTQQATPISTSNSIASDTSFNNVPASLHNPSATPPNTEVSDRPATLPQEPSTPSSTWKQYDSLSESDKQKVEETLFLMGKFGVGDSLYMS